MMDKDHIIQNKLTLLEILDKIKLKPEIWFGTEPSINNLFDFLLGYRCAKPGQVTVQMYTLRLASLKRTDSRVPNKNDISFNEALDELILLVSKFEDKVITRIPGSIIEVNDFTLDFKILDKDINLKLPSKIIDQDVDTSYGAAAEFVVYETPEGKRYDKLEYRQPKPNPKLMKDILKDI